jgi:hypothetical protein
MPEVSLNFKNLNPREIVLTDSGFYLDTMFFSNIFKSNSKKDSLQEFEAKREKIVSSRLDNLSSQQISVDLNFSGALSSPDATTLLLSFRRQKKEFTVPYVNSRIHSKRPANFKKNNRISNFITYKN